MIEPPDPKWKLIYVEPLYTRIQAPLTFLFFCLDPLPVEGSFILADILSKPAEK
jgi:hypothetical protein